MKTLDEVIKAWSICFSDNSRSNCTGCPYADEDGESACFNHDREDALIYLKAYQWQMTNPDGDRQQLEKCRALLSDFYRNDPLSWEELKQMAGMPVWVEPCKEWMLITEIETEPHIWLLSLDGLDYDMTLHNWQAYRKER